MVGNTTKDELRGRLRHMFRAKGERGELPDDLFELLWNLVDAAWNLQVESRERDLIGGLNAEQLANIRLMIFWATEGLDVIVDRLMPSVDEIDCSKP